MAMLQRATVLTRASLRANAARTVPLTRSYATETSTVTKKGSLGKRLVWTTAFGITLYGGATYAALTNEAFHDTYTTYIPGGERLLDTLEDAMQDAEFKRNVDTVIHYKNQAQQGAALLKQYALKAKDSALDIYDYTSEAVAQLMGEKEPPKVVPSDGTPAPINTSFKKRRSGGLFSNVTQTDVAARVPQFDESGEPALDELITTVQQLVKVLNDADMKGHARRLAEFAKRDIGILLDGLQAVRTAEAQLAKQVDVLSNDAADVEHHVVAHLDEVGAKIKAIRERSQGRLTEKENTLRADFQAEAGQLQRELASVARDQLNNQRTEYLAALTKELQQQALEIQRQYVRDVRHQVEEERGGRLSRIDEVVKGQRFVEQLSFQNAEDLDDSRKAHKVTVAIDALKQAAYAGNKQAFLDELQALLNISAPSTPFADVQEKRNDALVQVVASNISETVARHGIDSFAQLVERFDAVAAEVRRASLIPEEGSSMISHLISMLMSKLMFTKKGLVPGDDVEARLARAQYYLSRHNDLESAAREMNQLKGWPKHLSADWLDAARRHLEVKQAVEILRTQALLTSMLHV